MGGFLSYFWGMDKFLEEVRAYAAQCNVQPTTIIQRVGVGGGATWRRWESGAGSPTMRVVDRVRRYIAENPAAEDSAEDAA